MSEIRSRQTRRRNIKPRKPKMEAMTEVISEQSTVPYDETLLECARTQWQFGDWESLTQLSHDALQHHPQRAKLALLAAAGHFQVGEQNEAYRFIRLAQDWGCSRKLIAQMLIAGAHNSLGCAAVLSGREDRAPQHFQSAVTLGGIPGDAALLTEARSQKQWFRLFVHNHSKD